MELHFARFQDLAVSLHVRRSTSASSLHQIAEQTSHVTPARSGDHAGDLGGAAFAQKILFWPYLTSVQVAAPRRVGAVVNLGASTTDGVGSEPDTNSRYPDFLARRLAAAGQTGLSVLNAGISGNRLFGDFPRPYAGPSALSRLRRDVIDQAGAADVIVQLGTNDIGFPPARTRRRPPRAP